MPKTRPYSKFTREAARLLGKQIKLGRNHAAFWDGRMLSLTPAYDICPQGRSGNEATQAMLISGDNRMSRISSCLEAAHHFLLSREEALTIVADQLSIIGEHWRGVCEEARLSETDQTLLWGRQFLNPFAFDDLDGDAASLKALADDIREQ
jgi:serine/threonine-protein kinase HipA